MGLKSHKINILKKSEIKYLKITDNNNAQYEDDTDSREKNK